MTLPDKRRRQILDDEAEGDTSAPRNNRVPEDMWVTGFVRRLAALIRDVGGGRK
jgi:hypothetical protein